MKRFRSYSHPLFYTILAALFLPLSAGAQTSTQDSLWQPFKAFVGNWEGKGGGHPGTGDYTRTYRFVLNNRYIEVKNTSGYPPTADSPKGNHHEDWGYISYDRGRHVFVLRQFHIEGFVNQYKLDSISADGKRIVFLSEALENTPKGWRAKETYDILNGDEIRETFELAEPEKDFAVYSQVVLHRVK